MRATTTIIGAGPAGLAMSRRLTERAIDHVLLERGEVANVWHHERWDSLRLLTPNWMTRLPGLTPDSDDPDGYLTASQVAVLIERYNRSIEAPVHTHTTVTALRPAGRGFEVQTDRGPIRTDAVVVATGANAVPAVPALAAELPSRLQQVPSLRYRRPDQLDPGPVLVVGASASGVQIADELRRSGRDVTLAVGDHVRLPRTYRGRDILWWMTVLGLLDERATDVADLAAARRRPAAQLIGTPEHRSLGVRELYQAGVRVVGRLVGATDRAALFSGSLANHLRSADLKQDRLLDQIDAFVAAGRAPTEVRAPDRPPPTAVPPGVNELSWQQFGSVVWATGFRPDHSWIDPALLDRHGRVAHDEGVIRWPGMYILGLRFLRRRSSSFLYGFGQDTADLAGHLHAHLSTLVQAA